MKTVFDPVRAAWLSDMGQRPKAHRYKVLELPGWARTMADELPETRPLFYRDGHYYDRIYRESWVEFDGQAYWVENDNFLFSLSILNHRPLTGKEREAIENLRFLNRKLRKPLDDLLRLDTHWRDLRDIRRQGRWTMIKFLQEMPI